MAKLKKTVEQCTIVKISFPSTTRFNDMLYSKLYHFYDVGDAFHFAAQKINQGYKVSFEYQGDSEIFYDPSLIIREGV